MLRDPLFAFVLRHGGTDAALIPLVDSYRETKADNGEHTAFARLREEAIGGSPFAMCLCSRYSRMGYGTAKSDDDAFRWADSAAAASFAPGLYELGNCLEKGIGSQQDHKRAELLYKQAADGGFGFAAQRLGRAYYAGDFGCQDLEKAIQYMTLAVELGESLAALNLGEWYASGEVLPRNDKEAVRWYEAGSRLGDPQASLQLSMAYALGELGLPRDPSRAQQYEMLGARQSGGPPGG